MASTLNGQFGGEGMADCRLLSAIISTIMSFSFMIQKRSKTLIQVSFSIKVHNDESKQVLTFTKICANKHNVINSNKKSEICNSYLQ
jgi:hypothetical protein